MQNEKLLSLVRNEANLIKQHATTEEVAKLSTENFEPMDTDNCIYGQMTGDCRSLRAIELLNICAIKYSSIIDEHIKPREEDSFEKRKVGRALNTAVSPIEFYIYQNKWGDNKGEKDEELNTKLIEFLQGKREDII